jgi:transposase InsO family protein
MAFEDLEVDFTEVKPCQGYWYLLVLVCTYSGWVEAYPTYTKKAQEVVKTLLREINPRYGLPLSTGSGNRPAFMVEIVQSLAKILKIKWKLHTVYRPQSSGKVECMN